jgi:hypothetical protein
LARKKIAPAPIHPGTADSRAARSRTAYQKGVTALRDFIAPSSLEFKSKFFQLGTRYARTYYVYGYPGKFIPAGCPAWST